MQKIGSGVSGSVTLDKSGNFESIQGLRFVAALLVVITHSTLYATDRLGTAGSVWDRGVCGVDIFFVISGFVMVASTRRTWGQDDAWKKFAMRRLVRIVPMYWLATSIKLAMFVIAPAAILHSSLSLLHVVSSYLFIPTTNAQGDYAPLLGVGWTLDYEMFFYALFALALFAKRNVFISLGIVLAVASVLSIFRAPHMPAGVMYADSIVIEFFFGMLVAWQTFKQTKALPPWVSIAMVIVATLALLTPIADLWRPLPRMFYSGIPATLLVYGFINLEPYLKGRLPRIVIVFGDASYVLYLFHPLIAPIVPATLHKLGILVFPLSVLLSVALALTVATLIHLKIEVHATNWLKNAFVARPRREIVAP